MRNLVAMASGRVQHRTLSTELFTRQTSSLYKGQFSLKNLTFASCDTNRWMYLQTLVHPLYFSFARAKDFADLRFRLISILSLKINKIHL